MAHRCPTVLLADDHPLILNSLRLMLESDLNKTGTTQLRVYFNLDDNDDNGNDYIGYYSGDNGTAANRPQLVVTYQ